MSSAPIVLARSSIACKSAMLVFGFSSLSVALPVCATEADLCWSCFCKSAICFLYCASLVFEVFWEPPVLGTPNMVFAHVGTAYSRLHSLHVAGLPICERKTMVLSGHVPEHPEVALHSCMILAGFVAGLPRAISLRLAKADVLAIACTRFCPNGLCAKMPRPQEVVLKEFSQMA